MIRDAAIMRRRWVKVVPHVVDTLPIASAIALASMLRLYPLVHSWLTARVIALVIYITLGMVALRHGPTKGIRIAAWIGAQAVFSTWLP